jgi:hypothetical protein
MKYQIGDRVRLVIDEGLDTPDELQGKSATVVDLLSETEVMIEVDVPLNVTTYQIEPAMGYKVETVAKGKDYNRDALLIIFDTTENDDLQRVVAIAETMIQAQQAIEEVLGVTVEAQRYEQSHWDLTGQNGTYMIDYVAPNAHGATVAIAMAALAEVGYDLIKMLEDYILP